MYLGAHPRSSRFLKCLLIFTRTPTRESIFHFLSTHIPCTNGAAVGVEMGAVEEVVVAVEEGAVAVEIIVVAVEKGAVEKGAVAVKEGKENRIKFIQSHNK